MGRVVIANKSSGNLGVPATLLIKNNVNPICAWKLSLIGLWSR